MKFLSRGIFGMVLCLLAGGTSYGQNQIPPAPIANGDFVIVNEGQFSGTVLQAFRVDDFAFDARNPDTGVLEGFGFFYVPGFNDADKAAAPPGSIGFTNAFLGELGNPDPPPPNLGAPFSILGGPGDPTLGGGGGEGGGGMGGGGGGGMGGGGGDPMGGGGGPMDDMGIEDQINLTKGILENIEIDPKLLKGAYIFIMPEDPEDLFIGNPGSPKSEDPIDPQIKTIVDQTVTDDGQAEQELKQQQEDAAFIERALQEKRERILKQACEKLYARAGRVTNNTDLKIPTGVNAATLVMRDTRITELLQTLAQLNFFIEGTGKRTEGSFLDLGITDALGLINNAGLGMSLSGDEKYTTRMNQLLAMNGVKADDEFIKRRNKLLIEHIQLARKFKKTYDAYQSAAQELTNLETAKGLAEAYRGPYEYRGPSVEQYKKDIAAAKTEANRLRAEYQAMLTAFPLLSSSVGEISGHSGETFWQLATAKNIDYSQLLQGFKNGVSNLADHVREEITRLAQMTELYELITEFGSPLYQPMRDQLVNSAGWNEICPKLRYQYNQVAWIHGVIKGQEASQEALIDKLMLGGQVILVGASIIFPPSMFVTGAALTLTAVDLGRSGYNTYDAWNNLSAAESAVLAGGSVSSASLEDMRTALKWEAGMFVLNAAFAGLEVKDAIKFVRAPGIADDLAEAGASGTKAGTRASDDLVETGAKVGTKAGPKTGQAIVDPSTGKKITVGNYINSGEFSDVYAISGDPTRVIKFAKFKSGPDNLIAAAGKIEEAKEISDLLAANGIRQVKVEAIQIDGDQPFMITQRIPDDAVIYDYRKLGDNYESMIASGQWTIAHERALVGLFDDFAKKGLAWFDGHAGNVYFFTDADGVMRAGVLDHDFIAPLDDLGPILERELQYRFIEAPGANAVKMYSVQAISGALNRLPKDSHDFMLRMFEGKRWIEFDIKSGKYVPLRLDPHVIAEFDGFKKYFKPGSLPDAPVKRPVKSTTITTGPITTGTTSNATGRRAVEVAQDASETDTSPQPVAPAVRKVHREIGKMDANQAGIPQRQAGQRNAMLESQFRQPKTRLASRVPMMNN